MQVDLHGAGDRVTAIFAEQKDRLVLWLPVFFAVGIGFYFSLRFEPPYIISVPFLIGGLTGMLLMQDKREIRPLYYTGWLFCLITFLVSSGFFMAQARTLHVKSPILAKERGPVEITGTIKDIERLEGGQGNRIILKNIDIEGLKQSKTPHQVRIKLHDGSNIDIGDKVSLLARLNPPSAPVAPGAFDFQRYAYFKQIGAFGFAYRNPEIIEKGQSGIFQDLGYNLRQNIIKRIEKNLAYPEASFAITMLTGQRSTITEEDWEAMRSAGLAHMLAISGLHVGLIAGVLFFLSRLMMACSPRLALYHPIKKYAAVIAFLGALGYTFLVGASIPTQRALIMTGIALLAIVLDRDALSLRLAAIAAFIVLLITPEALIGAGFQMSFAAVIGLIAFYEAIRPYWSKWSSRASFPRRILLYAFGICMTTVIATIATAPFSIYHFQHLAPYSLPANLVAVPIMGFIVMPSVVLTLLLMPLGLEVIGLKIMGKGIEFILHIAHDISASPGAALLVPVWPVSGFLLIIASALFLILWKGRLRFISIAGLFISIFLIVVHKQPDIIISSDSELVLFVKNDKIFTSSTRKNQFELDVISRQFAHEKHDVTRFPLEGNLTHGEGIKCGEYGCRITYKNHKIAVSYELDSQKNDCEWADILISQNPVNNWNCSSNTIIDKFDLWQEGAHSIYITPSTNSAMIDTVAIHRGKRPWTINNR